MAILQTLQRTNWNKQEAAQILGLYRPTLYSKMKKHDIRDAGKAARHQHVQQFHVVDDACRHHLALWLIEASAAEKQRRPKTELSVPRCNTRGVSTSSADPITPLWRELLSR